MWLFPLGLPELSVPELTRSADIKLNDGLLLLRIRTALSSGCRAALAENTHHSPRGHDFNCSTGAAGFPQNRRPRLVIAGLALRESSIIFSECCVRLRTGALPDSWNLAGRQRPHDRPSGSEWVHEIKHDGFRLQVRREGSRVRCFTLITVSGAHAAPEGAAGR